MNADNLLRSAAPSHPRASACICGSNVVYSPLRVRSNWSLLSGASPVEALVGKAARSGMPALALTDECNLYGAVGFFEKAKERGIRPVLGCVLDGPEGEVVLLVRDETGYANLCELISARHLDERFSLASAIPEHQEGLFVLASDAPLLEVLAAKLGRGRLWCEVLRPTRSINAERRLLDTAKRFGLGVVASADVFFADAPDHELHEALVAMRTGCPLPSGPGATDRPTRSAQIGRVRCEAARTGYLRAPDEFARLFDDLPEAVHATREIAGACEFDLLARRPVFPKLAGDSASDLREQTLAGARERYGKLTSRVRSRLDEELGLIARLGFADYFLVVADIVRHARKLGTPVAGRGSGASSAVAYSLGITNVDPIRYHLPFARFLNEGRRDFPDLDIDFCWRLRDGVIDYVYRKHGDDHVAMIATYATMQPRLAFRESAKVLGLSNPVITKVAE
ncbi:MAG: PHP domain-containing protein, partial [Planctomycetota bacterium]